MLQHDRVFDLAALDQTVVVDRAERADIGVDDAGLLADDRRAANRAIDDLGTLLDDHLADQLRVAIDVSFDYGGQLFQDQAISLKHIVLLAGIDPPSLVDVGEYLPAMFDEPLDRVGDLQFAAPGWRDRIDRLPDARIEQVNPNQRQIGARLTRLLGQADDAPMLVKFGDAVLLRVRDTLEYDLRVVVAVAELLDQQRDPALDAVIAQEHDEALVAEKVVRDLDRVRQAERLVLRDILDSRAPALASPTAARTSGPVSPITMPISSIPASRIASITRKSTGLLATGTSCFALVYVIGRRRVPLPPLRTNPLITRCSFYRYRWLA